MLLSEMLKGLPGSKYLRTRDAGENPDRLYPLRTEYRGYVIMRSRSGRYMVSTTKGGNEFSNDLTFPNKEEAQRYIDGIMKDEGSSVEELLKHQKETNDMKDAPEDIDYYGLIVSAAREKDNPKLPREDAKNRLIPAFKTVAVKFDEEKFNKAFYEFRRASGSRIYR